jgi:hypothetical protein
MWLKDRAVLWTIDLREWCLGGDWRERLPVQQAVSGAAACIASSHLRPSNGRQELDVGRLITEKR